MEGSTRRRIAAFALRPAALTGAVVAHMLAYLIVFPQALTRNTVLAETGHSYWTGAEALAVVCALIASSDTVTRHFRRGRRPDRAPGPWAEYRSSAIRLGALQTAIFLTQESLERLHAGVPLAGLAHDGLVFVGVAVQLAVAAFLALVLTLLGLTAEAVGRALGRRRVRPVREGFLRPQLVRVPRTVALSGFRTRAPPAGLLRAI
jgi:ABC-type Fe3+-siderophore transport system permease subunit